MKVVIKQEDVLKLDGIAINDFDENRFLLLSIVRCSNEKLKDFNFTQFQITADMQFEDKLKISLMYIITSHIDVKMIESRILNSFDCKILKYIDFELDITLFLNGELVLNKCTIDKSSQPQDNLDEFQSLGCVCKH